MAERRERDAGGVAAVPSGPLDRGGHGGAMDRAVVLRVARDAVVEADLRAPRPSSPERRRTGAPGSRRSGTPAARTASRGRASEGRPSRSRASRGGRARGPPAAPGAPGRGGAARGMVRTTGSGRPAIVAGEPSRREPAASLIPYPVPMGAAVEVQELTKVYRSGVGRREVRALGGVSFRVEPGQLFGLLGPNGAGKTTAVKILLGLTHATSGEARLLGLPVSDPESRRRVGYLPEGHRFPGYLTARQTLSVFGRMSGVDHATLARADSRPPRADEALRLGRREGEAVLQGDDAAARPRGRARPRSGGPPPRRADGRRRPGRAARDPRPPPGRGGDGAGRSS